MCYSNIESIVVSTRNIDKMEGSLLLHLLMARDQVIRAGHGVIGSTGWAEPTNFHLITVYLLGNPLNMHIKLIMLKSWIRVGYKKVEHSELYCVSSCFIGIKNAFLFYSGYCFWII